MGSTVLKIVDCVRNGEVIKSYPLSYGKTMGPTSPPDLIKAAKENLIREGFVKPPHFDFTGIEFKIRDSR